MKTMEELEKQMQDLSAANAVIEMMEMFSEVLRAHSDNDTVDVIHDISMEMYSKTQKILDRVNGK